MNWNLKLISGELGKIYNIDGFYGMGEWECENHPVKILRIFATPPENGNVTSSVVVLGYFTDSF